MKSNTIYKLLLTAVASIVLLSCNDTLSDVGLSIQPGGDKLSVGTDTLTLSANTIQVESINAKTDSPVLGEYLDSIFGTVKSDYVGEFYFPAGKTFPSGSIIDSVRLYVSYTSWTGDSLAPMQLSVYKLNKQLPQKGTTTDLDVTNYIESNPIGQQIFSGKNSVYHTQTVSSTTSSSTINVYDIIVDLPLSLGEEFLAESKKPDSKLKDSESLREFFPGLYMTTTFGNSTMINVELTSFVINYHYNDIGGSSTGQDTIRKGELPLYITPEVTQLNTIQNKNANLLTPNANMTYIKSPAGVNTEIVFPMSQVADQLKSQALNLANFKVQAVPAVDNGTFQLKAAPYLLLINKDSLSSFFQKKTLPNSVTTFYAAFNSTTYTYDFGNISAMVNHYKEKNNGTIKDLTYLLVPVSITQQTSQSSYYGSQSSVLTGVYNLMTPSATTISKKPENLKLEMIFSKF
jgi:hypothetical protein